MAIKTIILKNTTLSGLNIRGKTIPASSSVDFTGYQGAFQYQLAQDVIDPLLASGDLVINNGIEDLTVEEAEIYLYDELFFTLKDIEDGDVLRGTATKGIALASPLTLDDLLDADPSGASTGDVLTFDGNAFIPQAPGMTGGGSLGRVDDVIEFGTLGTIKDVFINSAYSSHTSVDSTAIALTAGRIIHATISSEDHHSNWFVQIILGASKQGGVHNVDATTTADISGTYDPDVGNKNGRFDPVDLTNTTIFDGETPMPNKEILVKDQSDPKQNGIYKVTVAGATGILERETIEDDFDADGGFLVKVEQGIIHGDEIWELQGGPDQVLNTDDLDWAIYTGSPILIQFSGGVQVGADIEKPEGVLDKAFTNLTGYEFAAGDRIAVYIKKGSPPKDEAKEPIIRLYLQYD